MINYKKVAKVFELEVLVGSEEALLNEVPNKHFSNAAYELTGESTKLEYPVIFAKKEMYIFDNSSPEGLSNAFDRLMASGVKAIFLTKAFVGLVPESLLEKAKNNDVIVLLSHTMNKTLMRTKIPQYVAHHTSEYEQIHASLVNVYGCGVLVRGPSGIGKSELVLDLITKGHLFVADDAVQLRSFGNEIIGTAPEVTKNLLEVRGIGIINIRHSHGIQSVIKDTKICLIIQLIDKPTNSITERLGAKYEMEEFLTIPVTKISIPVNGSKNVSTLVETAVINYRLKTEEGYAAFGNTKEVK